MKKKNIQIAAIEDMNNRLFALERRVGEADKWVSDNSADILMLKNTAFHPKPLPQNTEECICNDYDGKGVSTCGFPCPVHKPQNAEVLREIENLKVDARPEIKDWILSGSKKEALAYNKAIDDVLALLVK